MQSESQGFGGFGSFRRPKKVSSSSSSSSLRHRPRVSTCTTRRHTYVHVQQAETEAGCRQLAIGGVPFLFARRRTPYACPISLPPWRPTNERTTELERHEIGRTERESKSSGRDRARKKGETFFLLAAVIMCGRDRYGSGECS